jgi:predicted DNA-binding transcriptional regulator AlpA
MLPDVHHLVGPHEIATMLGVSRQRVYQLVTRPDFPRPEARLKQGTVWRTEEVQQWAERTGRTIHDDTDDA